MSRRKLLLIAGAVLTVGLVAGFCGLVYWDYRNRTPTADQCIQIKPGLTEAEVEGIIGRPGIPRAEWRIPEGKPPASYGRLWPGSTGDLLVAFDERGAVVYYDIQPHPDTSVFRMMKPAFGRFLP